MRWSLRVITLAGIGVYVHWTFLLLIGWVAFMELSSGASAARAAGTVGFVITVFGCVVLHELGHALAARRFGIRTRDITLLPIGGVARLERIPEKPLQEFVVAIAGPLVNIAIAALLLPLVMLTTGFAETPAGADGAAAYIGSIGFAERLLYVNLFLVLFNMIPAFPMDGGRILRAALATRLPYARATAAAATVGQVVAIGFAFLGLFVVFNPLLLLIAVFVFLGAQAEARSAELRGAFDGVPVRDAMMTQFVGLRAGDTLADAARELLDGSQQDFPVLDGERLVGVLPRADLLRAMAAHGPGAPVASVMRAPCRPVRESDTLASAFALMESEGCPLVAVERGGRLVGLLTPENVIELTMVRAALGGRRAAGA